MDELVFVRVRQRLEQQRAEHTEDGRVDSDAKRQRQHGDGRECRRLDQPACRISEVGLEIVEQQKSAGLAAFLFRRDKRTELGPGLAGGVVR